MREHPSTQALHPTRPSATALKERLVEAACAALASHGPGWLNGRAAARLAGQPELCQALVLRSRQLDPSDPRQMLLFASLADLAARGLDAARHGAQRVADLQALALAELGNAYRITGEPGLAEEAFERAHQRCEAGSRDPQLTARLLSLEVSLLGAERRFAQALPLLARLRLLYRQMGENLESARATVRQGMYAGNAGHADEAVRLLRQGLEDFAHEDDPPLAIAAIYSLAYVLVSKGEFHKARAVLWSAGGLYERCAGEVARSKRHGLMGRINAALGELWRAQPDLRRASGSLAQLGLFYPAVIAALDLADVLLRSGQLWGGRSLARAASRVALTLGLGHDALISVLILLRATDAAVPIEIFQECIKIALRDLDSDPRADPEN